MMNNEEKSLSPRTCEEFCAMMDGDSLSAEEKELLMAHLARCPRCKEEYDLLLLMRGSRLDPPAGFTESVMKSVRREKARGARRRVLTRVAGIACAAVLLVPALYVLVPHLRTEQKKAADLSAGGANTPAETSPETLCATEDIDLTYAQSPAEEDLTNGASSIPPDAADDCTGNQAPPLTPTSPSYAEDLPGSVSSTSPTLESPCDVEGETDPKEQSEAYESDALTKLRAIVGDEKVDEWLSAYTGAPDEVEKAAYEYFGLVP